MTIEGGTLDNRLVINGETISGIDVNADDIQGELVDAIGSGDHPGAGPR